MYLSQKNHMPKRIVWAMLKKREKLEKEKKYPCQKAWEKNACQRAWRKEKKNKERNKDITYFQITGIHPKERDSWFKGVPKIFRIRTSWKMPHTCTSWSKCMTCISLGPVFDLAKYVIPVCLNLIPTQNSKKKPLVVGMKKKAKYQMPL